MGQNIRKGLWMTEVQLIYVLINELCWVNHLDKHDVPVRRRTHFMRFSNIFESLYWRNGLIETSSYGKTIWNSKSMTKDIIKWFPAWYTNNVPVQYSTWLFTRNLLDQLFYLNKAELRVSNGNFISL